MSAKERSRKSSQTSSNSLDFGESTVADVLSLHQAPSLQSLEDGYPELGLRYNETPSEPLSLSRKSSAESLTQAVTHLPRVLKSSLTSIVRPASKSASAIAQNSTRISTNLSYSHDRVTAGAGVGQQNTFGAVTNKSDKGNANIFASDSISDLNGEEVDQGVGKYLFGTGIGKMPFFSEEAGHEQKDQAEELNSTFLRVRSSSLQDTGSTDLLENDPTSIDSFLKQTELGNRREGLKSSTLSLRHSSSMGDIRIKSGVQYSDESSHGIPTNWDLHGAGPSFASKFYVTTNTPRASIIATTLTNLYTTLYTHADKILSLVTDPRIGSESSTILNFPEDKLMDIVDYLQKMVDMIDYCEHNGKIENASVSDQAAKLRDGVSGARQNIVSAEAKFAERSEQEKLTKSGRSTLELNEAIIKSTKELVLLSKNLANHCIIFYYKHYECAMVIPLRGFYTEGRNRIPDHSETITKSIKSISANRPNYTESNIDYLDRGCQWFRTYFVGREYRVYYGVVDGERMLATVVKEAGESSGEIPDIRRVVSESSLRGMTSISNPNRRNSDPDTWRSVLHFINPRFNHGKLRRLTSEQIIRLGLEKDILNLDESLVSAPPTYWLHLRYKFGVLFIKDGQTREEEWFSNAHDSESFERFLDVLGRKIELKGYTGWAARLDTKRGDSGEYTYVHTWRDFDIAYHISTLIPMRTGDKQQVQRKRHIGNDIVCVVFVEGAQPFNPVAIKSQFLHVYIVVHEEQHAEELAYRVEIVTSENVPQFGPPLPDPPLFFDRAEMRAFISAKLINAENAALKAPKISAPNSRAREGIFANLVERLWTASEQSSPRLTHHKTNSTSSQVGARMTVQDTGIRLNDGSSGDIHEKFLRSATTSVSEGFMVRRQSQYDLTTGVDSKHKSATTRQAVTKRNKSDQDISVESEPLEYYSNTSLASTDLPRGTVREEKSFRFRAQNLFSFKSRRERDNETKPRSYHDSKDKKLSEEGYTDDLMPSSKSSSTEVVGKQHKFQSDEDIHKWEGKLNSRSLDNI